MESLAIPLGSESASDLRREHDVVRSVRLGLEQIVDFPYDLAGELLEVRRRIKKFGFNVHTDEYSV